MTEDEYWAAIGRIPLYKDRECADGKSWLCRTADGQPVSVDKPENFRPEHRVAILNHYRAFYGPSITH